MRIQTLSCPFLLVLAVTTMLEGKQAVAQEPWQVQATNVQIEPGAGLDFDFNPRAVGQLIVDQTEFIHPYNFDPMQSTVIGIPAAINKMKITDFSRSNIFHGATLPWGNPDRWAMNGTITINGNEARFSCLVDPNEIPTRDGKKLIQISDCRVTQDDGPDYLLVRKDGSGVFLFKYNPISYTLTSRPPVSETEVTEVKDLTPGYDHQQQLIEQNRHARREQGASAAPAR